MYFSDFYDIDYIVLASVIYLLLTISIVKIGSERKCGGIKALIVSLFLTPIAGLIYVLNSPLKNLLKTIHYRCSKCGLEYTSNHKYCPSCLTDGENFRLEKIKMKTF